MRPLVQLRQFEVFADGLDHPEGLAFDREDNLWVGGELGQVYRIAPSGYVKEVTRVGGFNLGITVSASQDIFLCNFKAHALIRIDRSGKVLGTWDRAGSYRFRTPNFSVFDSSGNLYFSDSGEWRQNDGYILVLRPSGKVEVFAGPLSFPNGLSLSADERTLFVVESTADAVTAISIRADGSAGKRRIFARGLHSVPDGCGLDTGGNLCVTCYASHNIYKVSPKGKVSLVAVDPRGTMIAGPTNLAFGRDGYIYFANLSRWHICRTKAGLHGQPLVGER
jgi:gluconolactonase